MTFSTRTLDAYDFIDALSGLLLFASIIFAPWALGATEPWAIWTLNALCYALGALLLAKTLIRAAVDYRFPRWDGFGLDQDGAPKGGDYLLCRKGLLFLTVLLLAYCLTHALNARSIFDMDTLSFGNERPYIKWLPASFDAPHSWEAFWKYLGLALAFWALHDWLMGKSSADLRGTPASRESTLLPFRLQCLLWVLSVNGALLAIEGIAQRGLQSNKLLFFVQSLTHFTSNSQFGPFNYRSNACQYFNMIWPATLGFWWSLHRNRRDSNPPLSVRMRHILPTAAALMAICPLISSSRLGAFTTVAAAVIVATILVSGLHSPKSKAIAIGSSILVLGLGLVLGWGNLVPRLSGNELEAGFMGRNLIYEVGRKMADNYPLYGTGPGTYGCLSLFYVGDPNEFWYQQLHNDWLETLITFGWVGMLLIAAAFLLLLGRWYAPGPLGGGRRLPALLCVSLATCLLQARWDFPFQILSIIHLFMILCGVFFVLSSQRIR